MSKQPLEIMKQSSRRFDILVVIPLIFVTVFCFGFVLMHPYYKGAETTASLVTASKNHTKSSSHSNTIVELTSPLPQLTTVAQSPAAISSSTAQTQNPAATASTPPQSSTNTNSSSGVNPSTATKAQEKKAINQLFRDLQSSLPWLHLNAANN